MTTFIKVKLNKSDDLTHIAKYRVAANILEYHIISKIYLPKNHEDDDKAIILCKKRI